MIIYSINDVRAWWNSNKDNSSWCGAIIGVDWDDLWQEAQDDLVTIFLSIKQ